MTDKSVKRILKYILVLTAVFMLFQNVNIVSNAEQVRKAKVFLNRPKITRIDAYENGVQKIYWEGDDVADYYLIFRKEAGKKYKQIGKTKKLHYTDKKGRAGKKYYYKVQAVTNETGIAEKSLSEKSKAVKKICRKKPVRVAYIGDSVMSGFAAYGALNGNEKSFAKVSLFVHQIKSTFLGSVNAYKPDRVYIMCGTNNCVGNQSKEYLTGVKNEYVNVVDSIHKANPNCEIVIMGVGNTRSSRVPNANVNNLNKLLSAESEKRSYTRYFDTGACLNDGSGCLSSSYASGDGIHWNAAAYKLVHERLQEFMKVY